MSSKFYFYLKGKIDGLEKKLADKLDGEMSDPYRSKLFSLNLILLNQYLVLLSIFTDLVKYLIILFSDAGTGFNVLFKQRELRSCPYSYSHYSVVRSKIRAFSISGLSALVLATAFSSLFLNLWFGGKLPTRAAAYGWLQSSWSAGVSTTSVASHSSDQENWASYFSKDDDLEIANGGADLRLKQTAGSFLNTSDSDFATGTMSGVAVAGTGNDASVELYKRKAKVSGGTYYSLLLRKDGSLMSVGSNSAGQLGDNTQISRWQPVRVKNADGSDFVNVVDVSAGSNHSLAVKTDGTVWGWGANSYSQLGISIGGVKKTPTQIFNQDGSPFSGVIKAEAGDGFSIFLKNDGTIWSTGQPVAGATGLGTTSQDYGYPYPVKIKNQDGSDFSQVVDVFIGFWHVFALKADGSLWAWGRNGNGQLCIGNINETLYPTQVVSSDGSPFTGVKKVAGGNWHSLFLKNDGTVYGCGYASVGWSNSNTEIYYPDLIKNQDTSDFNTVVDIGTSERSNYAVKADGSLWGWGDLPSINGASNNYAYPTVSTEAGFSSVSGSYDGGLGIKNDGSVWSWGGNSYGQLGNNSDWTSYGPVRVKGEIVWNNIVGALAAVSSGNHSMILKSDGSILAWGSGNNAQGYIGDGSTAQRTEPVYVRQTNNSYFTGATAIAVGSQHSLALKADGTVWGWGYNAYGQVGNNSTNNVLRPTKVKNADGSDLTGVIAIAAGTNYSVALKSDGTVWSWGQNAYGTLCNNSTTNSSTTVQARTPAGVMATTAVAIAVGSYNTFVINSDKSIWGCGDNGQSQIGQNAIGGNYYGLTRVKGVGGSGYLANVVSASVGQYHVVALTTTGAVYGWGSGSMGRLDRNEEGQYYTPTLLTITNASSSAASSMYTSIRKNDKTVWGFGYSELGNGATPVIVKVATQALNVQGQSGFLTGIDYLSAGKFTYAIRNLGANSELFYWGSGTTLPTYQKAWIQQTDYIDALTSLSDYSTSGTYTSAIIDIEKVSYFNNFNYNKVQQANTGITIDIRAGNTSDLASAVWQNNIQPAGNLEALNNNRYVQYRVNFTSDGNQTPSFNDVSFDYSSYNTNQSLVSSVYDSTDEKNIIDSVRWLGTTPVGTEIAFQARSSADGLNWTDWTGPDGTASSTFTNPDGSQKMPFALRDGFNDRYFQYKAILNSNGQDTPVLSEIDVNYAAFLPEISITNNLSQGADGLIIVNYRVKDVDTDNGTPPGLVDIGIDYCTANCNATGSETWLTATTSSLSGQFGQVAVNQNDFTEYSLSFNPKIDFDNHYLPSGFKIRITADDLESDGYKGYYLSSDLALDTKNPVGGTLPIKINAGAIPASLTLDATDNSSIFMKVGLNSDLSDVAEWQEYSASTTLTFSSDPDTAYVQFKDGYANQSPVYSLSTIETPSNVVVRDLSNFENGTYSLFLIWKMTYILPGDFSRYNVWRGESVSGQEPESYQLLTTISTSTKNHYQDDSVAGDSTYYYKVSAEDKYGNTSFVSVLVSDKPDGQGGTDKTPPTISNIEITSSTTQSVSLSFATDELAQSIVYYISEAQYESAGDDKFAEASEAATVNLAQNQDSAFGAHKVSINGLSSATKYYYKVKATDPSGNSASVWEQGGPLMFETKTGPQITQQPVVRRLTNNSADIMWETDIAASTVLYFSANPDFSDYTEASSSEELTTAHVINLTELTPGSKYYFYVKSVDVDGNEVIGKNVVDWHESYFSFTTTYDTVKPEISDVSCNALSDKLLQVTWKTDEPARSWVEYGTEAGVYNNSTVVKDDLETEHSIVISDLNASTTYYLFAGSDDGNANEIHSAEKVCLTLEKLSKESEVKQREEAIRQEANKGQSASSGGGTIIIDKTDKVSPVISNISVDQITATSAVVTWQTSELADSFVKYGKTSNYDDFYGNSEMTMSHKAVLKNLIPETVYNFEVESKDSSGNVAVGNVLTFETKKQTTEDALSLVLPADEEKKEDFAKETAKKALEVIAGLASQIPSALLESIIVNQYDALANLAKTVPAPIISTNPVIETTPTSATIGWYTDKESNSLIAYAPESIYNLQKNDKGYSQLTGNPDVYLIDHRVVIAGLKPQTVYHFQVRSKSRAGVVAASRDFTFKTKEESLEILNYFIENISPTKATFRWATNLPSNSEVSYTPYRGGKLAAEEMRLMNDSKAYSINHQIELSDLESGTVYQIDLVSADEAGKKTSKTISLFSTTKDDLPPEIYQIQTESALTQGKDAKVQSVISWLTNEPAASQMIYGKGVIKDEAEMTGKTQLEIGYGKKHTAIITQFDPGEVYSFRIIAIDSGGNKTISSIHTILTPRQQASVFDLIVKNLEETFGWIGAVR